MSEIAQGQYLSTPPSLSTGAVVPLQVNSAGALKVDGSVSVSGGATAANQATGNASLAAIDAGVPAALGQAVMASSMPVAIASDQSAVPVSAAQLPSALVGGRLSTLDAPFEDMKDVTPNDGADLPDGTARGLYVTAAGNVSVVTAGGTTVTLAVDQYQILPLRVARVRSTSTTATVKAGY